MVVTVKSDLSVCDGSDSEVRLLSVMVVTVKSDCLVCGGCDSEIRLFRVWW